MDRSNLDIPEDDKVRGSLNKFASIGDDYGSGNKPRRLQNNGRRAGPRSATFRGKSNHLTKSSLNS